MLPSAMMVQSSLMSLATAASIILILIMSMPSCQALSLRPYNNNAPKVWLTVSSLIDKIRVNGRRIVTQRKLELNWMNLPINGEEFIEPNDSNSSSYNNLWIGMFDSDQTHPNSDDALVSFQPKLVSKGRFRSEVEFPMHVFTHENLTNECLGYYIYAFDGESQILAKNCIRAHPHWMEESMSILKDRSVKDIMIPGTHNAGSYELGYQSDARSILKKYVTCQDESVFNQLAYGIRYLDLRVSYDSVMNRRERLWIVHGILRTEVSLESVLRQVRSFMDATTGEIVILDFHRFEKGFDDHPRDQAANLITKSRHIEIMDMIESIVGPHVSRDTQGFHVKIGDLVQSGKRLIIGYAGNRFIREAHYYPRVRHLWAEADNASALESYFNRMMCITSGFEATSAMAQLTPSTWGVIFDKYDGLRKMAQDVNWLVSEWFEEHWWPCVNIVATDFFLGNNLIEISIQANAKRLPVPNRRFRRSITHQDQMFHMILEDERSSIWD